MRLIDLTGRRFGRWTVLKRGAQWTGKIKWMCRCDCGRSAEVYGNNLVAGRTESCGCLALEASRRPRSHGMFGTKIYRLWLAMKERCQQSTSRDWQEYGGRGITVCDRWQWFERFYEDMGDRPPGKTLDRKDNSGPYSPENCRWATTKEQNRNKRDNRKVLYRGQTKLLIEWCEELGLVYSTVWKRLYERGWSAEEAFGGVYSYSIGIVP